MSLTLVDASAWILATHRKNSDAQERLIDLISAGTAAACPMSLLECIVGRRAGENPADIRRRFQGAVWLSCTDAVWERAYELAGESRRRGQTLTASDAIMAAQALETEATLLHADTDFIRLAAWSHLKQESLLPA